MLTMAGDKTMKTELRQERYVTASSPKEFVQTAVNLYAGGWRKSLTVLGDIGVGKSDSVREIAKRIAHKMNRTFWEYDQNQAVPDNPFVFVDVRLTDLEPADLTGIPRDDPTDKDTAVFKTQRFVKLLAQYPGLLFLDEITNENRPNMKAASYRILRDRSIGFVRMHKDVMVIGAGNYPDDAVGIAEPMPAPMANRICIIEMKPPEVKDWIDYMNHNAVREVQAQDEDGKPKFGKDKKPVMEVVPDWDKRVAAFLQANVALLLQKPKEAATLENFPTPRAWSDLAKISEKIDIEDLKKAAEGTVGKSASMVFIQFISTKVDPIETFIDNPQKWETLKNHPDEVAAKYLLCCEIADKWADTPKMDALADYILEKNQDYMGIVFAMLERKNKGIVVQRCLKMNKKILNFIKDMTFWNYNAQDADGSAIGR